MEEKTASVASYLQSEFPGFDIETIRDASSGKAGTVCFRVDDLPVTYVLEVSREFLADRSPEDIAGDLRKRDVGMMLRENQGKVLVLAEDGFLLR